MRFSINTFMVKRLITILTSPINEYLTHIDLKAYGFERMLSVYLCQFDEGNLLFDCGSSLDAPKLLNYFKEHEISLSSFKYLITSHHHFDHNGGLHLIYKKLKEFNPSIKILTNVKTKNLLNNYENHLARAKRTYGAFVGRMESIEESAFKIVQPSDRFLSNNDMLDRIEDFHHDGEPVSLAIFTTPGHTPDHQCPILIKDGKIDFIYWGEAVGTLYHSTELYTMPTSMPTYYDHEQYMSTLKNLKILHPLKAGFGHFGVVNGLENVRKIINEHEKFMKDFRAKVIQLYREKPETKYIVEKITPMLNSRTDLKIGNSSLFNGIVLGIVYGMLMDLGYRKE
jgi:glyoxylase-like metal-dependent hydrolase (beta-lactamase superfamily II)